MATILIFRIWHGISIYQVFEVFWVFQVFRVEETICNRGFEEEDEGERGKADTDGNGF